MNLPSRSARVGCLMMSGLAAVLGLVVSIFLIFALRGRDPSPEFTRAEFQAARELWEQVGPESYDMEVQVLGRQPAVYRVEIRSGDVVSATIDGRPLKQRRTFETWSVPGMFGTMERDVENVEKFTSGRVEKDTPRLTLRATFDPTYGYPARFRRIEWGTDRDSIWEVREFRVHTE